MPLLHAQLSPFVPLIALELGEHVKRPWISLGFIRFCFTNPKILPIIRNIWKCVGAQKCPLDAQPSEPGLVWARPASTKVGYPCASTSLEPAVLWRFLRLTSYRCPSKIRRFPRYGVWVSRELFSWNLGGTANSFVLIWEERVFFFPGCFTASRVCQRRQAATLTHSIRNLQK